MTLSAERLAILRAMPYEEYRATPEWQARQKSILTQGSFCQICQTEERLGVYHYTLEHQGAEQDTDLLILCVNCYENTRSTNVPTLPFLHKAGVFLGVAGLSTIGLEGFLQAPLPAEIGALVAAWYLAKNSPAVYAAMRKTLSPEVMAWMERWMGLSQAPDGKRSRVAHWFRSPQPDKTAHPSSPSAHAEPAPTQASQDAGEGVPEQAPLSPVFPEYPGDETLRMGQAIDAGALAICAAAYQTDPKKPLPEVSGCRFSPHINALFGRGAIFAAVQGAGKSMLSGLIIEQAGECDAPVIVLDHKGEYTPITELTSLNGLLAGGPSARKRAERIGVPFFELTTTNADAFVEKVITGHHQAIVSLPSYGDKWLDKASIVAEVGQALMRDSGRRREQGKKILPCLVFLDEAQLYIPQNANLLPPEARRNGEVLDSLSNGFFALVSNGRSNGYTMCFATQSLTYIAKWAIKSCQIKVLMRHVEYNDLNMCEEIIGPKGVATRGEVETLPSGVGVVFGFTPKPMVVQFDRRQSRDESETPTVERLREARNDKTIAPAEKNTVKVGDLSLDELVALLGQTRPANRPDTEELANPDGPLPLGQEASISREMFDVAIRLRKSGLSTGYRDLMDAFVLTDHYARRLNKLIEDEIARETGGS